VNSVPLWLIIVAEKSTLAVYGNKTTESQSARDDERTETTNKEDCASLCLSRLCGEIVML
jgi:hypothetical protein